MNTKMNATGGGVQSSRKLLAALAVLAVAFVVLAAVPSVAADATNEAPVYEDGVIAAGNITGAATANSVISALRGNTISDSAEKTMFVVYYTSEQKDVVVSGSVEGKTFGGDSTGTIEKEKLSKGVHVIYWTTGGQVTGFDDAGKTATVNLKIGDKTYGPVTISPNSVTLYQDVSIGNNTMQIAASEEGMVFDLGGKTLDSTARAILLTAGTLEVKNGTVESVFTEANKDSSAIRVGNTTTVDSSAVVKLVVAEDATVRSIGAYGIGAFINGSSTVDYSKTTVQAEVYGNVVATNNAALSGNGSVGGATAKFVIKDSATVTGKYAGIYMPGRGSIEIDGGSVSGYSGVVMKSGKLVMTDGSIIATGANRAPMENNNGFNATGAAIQIESNKASGSAVYYGDVEVSISGGSVVSENGIGIQEYLAESGYTTQVNSISVTGGSVTGLIETISVSSGAESKVRISGGDAGQDIETKTVSVPESGKTVDDAIKTAIGTAAPSGKTDIVIRDAGKITSSSGTVAVSAKSAVDAAIKAGYESITIIADNEDVELKDDIVLIAKGQSITASGFKSYSGSVVLGDSKSAAATFNGVAGDFRIVYGSVDLSGQISAGTITLSEESFLRDITLSGSTSVTIEGDKTLHLGNVVLEGTAKLIIKSGVKVQQDEGTAVTVGATTEFQNSGSGMATVKVGAGVSTKIAGNVDIQVVGTSDTEGVITGDIASDSLVIKSGQNVKFVGTISVGKLNVEKDATLAVEDGKKIAVSGQAEIYGSVTGVTGTLAVGKEAYVTIAGQGVTVSKIVNDGTVIVKEKATVSDIENNKTVRVYEATITTGKNNSAGTIYLMDQKAQVTVSGEGKIDVSAVTETLEIAGSIAPGETGAQTNYPAYQTVIVTKDTVVKNGAHVTINGSFIVNEGVTLTVEEGATITVTSVTGSFQNNGAVVSEGEIAVTANSKFLNNGTLSLACEETAAGHTHIGLAVDGGAIFENVGELSVGEDSTVSVTANNNAIAFKNSGKVSVEGAFTGKISNTGSVRIASEKVQDLDIDNADVSATVEVAKMKGTLTVTDAGMKNDKKKINDGKNEIEIATDGTTKSTISGISIAEATYKPTSDAKTYDVKMLVSGSVAASDVATGTTQSIQIVKGTVEVSSEMTIGQSVAFTQTAGTFTVSGTMVFAKERGIATFDGKVVVTGSLSAVKDPLTIPNFVGASYNIAGSGSVEPMYYYTGIEAAIAAADGTKVKEISISAGTSDDKSEIAADATIVKDVTAKLKGELSVKKGATFTVADGAKLKEDGTAKIVVAGKLVIENVKTAAVNGIVIDSEVVAVEGDRQVYTSLATAIADAGENVVTIKLSKAATISEDLVIPTNITVDTNDTSGVTVSKNVTLEIDGTLLLKGAAKLTLEKAAAGSEDKDAKAVLNGYIKAGTETGLQADVAGAYYTVGDHEYYMVCGVAKAPEAVLTADDLTIAIYKGLSQDIAFAGAADKTVKISVYGDVKASVTLSYAVLTVQDGKIAGKIAGANGSVQFKDATAKILVATASVADDVETLVIAGTVDAQAGADKEPSVVFDGAVAVKGATVKIDATVVGNLTVSGTESFADVVVEGTLEVDNKAKLTVKNLEIFGAVAVADKNDKGDAAGELKADLIYIGISEKTVTGVVGADASLTAPAEKVAYGTMFVAPAGKVSADLVKDVKSTAYYVDDALYLTAYAGDAPELISFVKYVDKTAKVGEWQVDGEDVSATAKIGSVEKVVLDLDYNVYTVAIVGDAGVGSVAINGVLFVKYEGMFVLPTKLKAGTYTVTVSAAADYDISGIKLSDSEGKDLSMKITLAGDFNEANDNIYYLSGSVPAVTPTPDPTPIIIKDEDDGMSLTDILLIVLVVLIVIMAAIVALRMMRS